MMGYASSPDGIDWAVHPESLIMTGIQLWDAWHRIPGGVIHNGSSYEMWYTGSPWAVSVQIGYATSPDGIAWTAHPDNPVIPLGSASEWDDLGTGYTAVIQ